MHSGALQDGIYTVLVVDRIPWDERDVTTARARAGLVERHGGDEVGETAGGSAVVFRSAGAAVRCAVAIQQAQGPASALALGVHAGEVLAADGTGAGTV